MTSRISQAQGNVSKCSECDETSDRIPNPLLLAPRLGTSHTTGKTANFVHLSLIPSCHFVSEIPSLKSPGLLPSAYAASTPATSSVIVMKKRCQRAFQHT